MSSRALRYLESERNNEGRYVLAAYSGYRELLYLKLWMATAHKDMSLFDEFKMSSVYDSHRDEIILPNGDRLSVRHEGSASVEALKALGHDALGCEPEEEM